MLDGGTTSGGATGGDTTSGDATGGDATGCGTTIGDAIGGDATGVGASCGGAVAGFTACACARGDRACEKIAAPKMIPKDLQIKVLIALTPKAFGARIRSRPSTQVA